MPRRFYVAVAIVGRALGFLAVPAWANTVIDFGTGIAGYGGTMTLYADGNLGS